MNKHAKTIKSRLESIIKDITENSHLYVKNPEKDFTRNRKLSFEEMFKILLSIGGNSLKIELMEYFSYDVKKIATTSAFIGVPSGKCEFTTLSIVSYSTY